MERVPVNVSLFVQINPNVSGMSKALRLSRETIYRAINGTVNTRPATANKINKYLADLFKARMATAKKLRAGS